MTSELDMGRTAERGYQAAKLWPAQQDGEGNPIRLATRTFIGLWWSGHLTLPSDPLVDDALLTSWVLES